MLFELLLAREEGRQGRQFRLRSKWSERRSVALPAPISMAAPQRPLKEAVFEDAQRAVLFGSASGEVPSRRSSEFAGESPVAPEEAWFRRTVAV